MFYKRKFELTSLLLLVVIAALLYYSFSLFDTLFYSEMTLIFLAILSVCVLSDVLIDWLILLNVVVATIILVAGIVYLPMNQILLLIFTFPLIAALANKVKSFCRVRISAIQDEKNKVTQLYKQAISHINKQNGSGMQLILVSWAHSDYFKQINPKAYRKMLKDLYETLENTITAEMSNYYVSNGSVLICIPNPTQNYQAYVNENIMPKLSNLHFINDDIIQEIQFKRAYLTINQKNVEKFKQFEEALKNLDRQLETDIIVEY